MVGELQLLLNLKRQTLHAVASEERGLSATSQANHAICDSLLARPPTRGPEARTGPRGQSRKRTSAAFKSKSREETPKERMCG
jgi:hypothetical protein